VRVLFTLYLGGVLRTFWEAFSLIWGSTCFPRSGFLDAWEIPYAYFKVLNIKQSTFVKIDVFFKLRDCIHGYIFTIYLYMWLSCHRHLFFCKKTRPWILGACLFWVLSFFKIWAICSNDSAPSTLCARFRSQCPEVFFSR